MGGWLITSITEHDIDEISQWMAGSCSILGIMRPTSALWILTGNHEKSEYKLAYII